MPRRKSVIDELPKVTERSTKAEIMDAYQQVIMGLDQVEVEEDGEQEKDEQRKELVKKHSATTVEEVLKRLTDLKMAVNKAVGQITEGLMEKSEQLNELVKTIDLEEKYLSEVEQIKANVKSLKQLVKLQEQQRREFDKEMTEKRQAWEEEQKQKARERKLEEDEYGYELKRKRREEEEEYQLKLKQKTEELKNREIVIKQAEEELADLKAKVEKMPQELEQAVEKAKKETRAKVEQEAAVKSNLLEKQVEGERNLAKAQVANLQETVKSQAERIASLERQLGQANDRIKEIAAGAVNLGKSKGIAEEANRKMGN